MADLKTRERIPAHVAFVMDGNGRWATQRGLPRTAGHREGIANVNPIANALRAHGSRYMTIYMFSTENWKRPTEEIDAIFELLVEWLRDTAPEMRSRGIAFRHLGVREPLPPALLAALDETCAEPVRADDLVLSLALNYGGRGEITDAIRKVIATSSDSSAIDEQAISAALYTAGMPDPDLLVRPGGETRLSNYLLWQAAYAELYFSQVLWPDFDERELDRALDEYAKRHRRFGGL